MTDRFRFHELSRHTCTGSQVELKIKKSLTMEICTVYFGTCNLGPLYLTIRSILRLDIRDTSLLHSL